MTNRRGGDRAHRRGRALALTTVGAMITMIALLTGTATAGAQGSCGEFSFGFTGTRLLNDGISNSAGPFAIVLPAGTYDVTLSSHDAHSAHPGQLEQTQESWIARLDSGWSSTPTLDIPLEQDTSITVLTNQVIGHSTAISVHHLGSGGINSVDVVCVGFTPVAAAAQETAVEEVVVAATEETSEPAETTEQTADIAEPATVVNTPAAETEVEGAAIVATPEVAPQLALTGPSATTRGIAILGVARLVFGLVLVGAERRAAAATI
ncbi:MAG: hypothetical protein ACR2P0_10465 [Acidimicrobiales bacterium]